MMNQFKYILLSIFLAIAIASCKDEDIPCVEMCGWQQECVDGACECPEGYMKLGPWCRKKTDEKYLGSLPCGCFKDDFIVSLDIINLNEFQLLRDNGAGVTDLTYKSDSTYKATVYTNCHFDGKYAYFADFTVDRLNEDEVNVHTRWWNVEGTVAECEAIFTNNP